MNKIINIVGKMPISDSYLNMIKKCGIDYLINSNKVLDGMLLTGGGDISPCLYGELNTLSKDIDLHRDVFELYLIKKYISHNKCIFGICRGLQIINVSFSGTIFQHIDNASIHSQCGKNKDKIHLINNVKNTFIYDIYNEKAIVASAHHQAIKKLGKELIVSSYSFDGIIEAIEHSNLNIFACQFHPERMVENNFSDGFKLFNYFKSKL